MISSDARNFSDFNSLIFKFTKYLKQNAVAATTKTEAPVMRESSIRRMILAYCEQVYSSSIHFFWGGLFFSRLLENKS